MMTPLQIKYELKSRGHKLKDMALELNVRVQSIYRVIDGLDCSNRIMTRISEIIKKPIAEIWEPRIDRRTWRES